MSATLALTVRGSNHQLHSLVEIGHVEGLLKTKAVAISRAAPWGKRSEPMRQLEKDVLGRKNRAFETIAKLLLGAQDNGVDLVTVLEFPQLLTAILRDRQEEVPELVWKEIEFLETQIECAMNPIQVAMMQGDRSTPRKEQLLALVIRNIDVLQKMQRVLEHELLALPAGSR